MGRMCGNRELGGEPGSLLLYIIPFTPPMILVTHHLRPPDQQGMPFFCIFLTRQDLHRDISVHKKQTKRTPKNYSLLPSTEQNPDLQQLGAIQTSGITRVQTRSWKCHRKCFLPGAPVSVPHSSLAGSDSAQTGHVTHISLAVCSLVEDEGISHFLRCKYRWVPLNPNVDNPDSGQFEFLWKSQIDLSCLNLPA